MSKKTTIGGQALIEGIMMKGPHKTTMAVRNTKGEIILEPVESGDLRKKFKILSIPIIRGVVAFIESLYWGYKALMRSADLSGYTEIEEENNADGEETGEDIVKDEEHENNDNKEKKEPEKLSAGIMAVVSVIALILGFGLALVLFIWLPAIVFDKIINPLCGGNVLAFKPLFEGIMKMIFFVLYIYLVSLSKDIKRVFMYHGAEHKTIFCYEAGLPLTPENCAKQKRFHPRCGTSFMILMLVVSILVSSLIMIIAPGVANYRPLWVAIKLLLVPVIVGLGFELIRVCGKYENVLTRIISAPGMWLQRITTSEPDESMLEVAIAALTDVIPENGNDDNW